MTTKKEIKEPLGVEGLTKLAEKAEAAPDKNEMPLEKQLA